MNIFDVEYQYQLFLGRMALLPESKLHPLQKQQLRETFYGACGQMMILLRDDLSVLPEEEGIKKLHEMLMQVQAFFIKSKTHG